MNTVHAAFYMEMFYQGVAQNHSNQFLVGRITDLIKLLLKSVQSIAVVLHVMTNLQHNDIIITANDINRQLLSGSGTNGVAGDKNEDVNGREVECGIVPQKTLAKYSFQSFLGAI